MKAYKVRELSGKLLDRAVEVAIHGEDFAEVNAPPYSYCWHDGGPIIEQYEICLSCQFGAWQAFVFDQSGEELYVANAYEPLTAAMRCFVRSRMGDEVTM